MVVPAAGVGAGRRTSRPRFLAIAAPPASARSAAEPAAIGYCQHTVFFTASKVLNYNTWDADECR